MDPLVNSEAVFYGKFVQAAYAMFKRDRGNLKPEPQPGRTQTHLVISEPAGRDARLSTSKLFPAGAR